LFGCGSIPLFAQNPTRVASPATPIRVKVVVVAMFERGEDTGDIPGEYQLWVEREHLDQVLPLPAGYHHVRMNKDGVLGMLTGVATAKAAASVMALGLDSRFDLTKAYWLIAGIGGGDPADVSLGSAVWANHVIDGDIGYEIDAREIPQSWPTGFVPLRMSTPYEQPVRSPLDGELYALNQDLVAWAVQLTKDIPLADSEEMRASRARFTGFPNAMKPPFVTRGDAMSSSTFWHGTRMDEWANAWTRYFTGGHGRRAKPIPAVSHTVTRSPLRGRPHHAPGNRIEHRTADMERHRAGAPVPGSTAVDRWGRPDPDPRNLRRACLGRRRR